MAATVFDGVDAVRAAVGQHLGYSEWLEITQDRVNLFADATGDHQWIHVDPERAKDGPFGGPDRPRVPDACRCRTSSCPRSSTSRASRPASTTASTRSGSRRRSPSAPSVRGGAELAAVEEVKGGIQTTMVITIEIEGQDQPACIIESLSRYLV